MAESLPACAAFPSLQTLQEAGVNCSIVVHVSHSGGPVEQLAPATALDAQHHNRLLQEIYAAVPTSMIRMVEELSAAQRATRLTEAARRVEHLKAALADAEATEARLRQQPKPIVELLKQKPPLATPLSAAAAAPARGSPGHSIEQPAPARAVAAGPQATPASTGTLALAPTTGTPAPSDVHFFESFVAACAAFPLAQGAPTAVFAGLAPGDREVKAHRSRRCKRQAAYETFEFAEKTFLRSDLESVMATLRAQCERPETWKFSWPQAARLLLPRGYGTSTPPTILWRSWERWYPYDTPRLPGADGWQMRLHEKSDGDVTPIPPLHSPCDLEAATCKTPEEASDEEATQELSFSAPDTAEQDAEAERSARWADLSRKRAGYAHYARQVKLQKEVKRAKRYAALQVAKRGPPPAVQAERGDGDAILPSVVAAT
jgi:hypothetical protein